MRRSFPHTMFQGKTESAQVKMRRDVYDGNPPPIRFEATAGLCLLRMASY